VRLSHIVVALAAAATVTLGCDRLSPKLSMSVEPDDGEGPILVGHFATMTGPEATFGQSTDHAIRLAVE